MKTFEEKWTAWIDGELTGHDLAEFEASLPDLGAAEAEKREMQKLGTFLKEHLPCRAMGNEEFFHHQLRERIASESAVPTSPSADGGRVWWPIRRLVWGGATALALCGGVTFFVMREKPATDQSQ
jgi:anti-sigma factor RsiW